MYIMQFSGGRNAESAIVIVGHTNNNNFITRSCIGC